MASPATIDFFKKLPEDKQRAALGKMSSEAKQALLDGLKSASTETTSTGITVPKGMIDRDDSSTVSGAFKRGRDVIRGMVQTVVAPPTAEEQKRGALTDDTAGEILQRPALVAGRVGRGFVEGEKQAAGQVKEQVKAAHDTKGDPVQKALAYARAGTTAASMADPFATGSVTNINKLEDEGKNREAIGAGTFDALTMLIGSRIGREPTIGTIEEPGMVVNKLAYATNADSIRPLMHVMPDIEETVKQVGKPKTVNDLGNVIQKTMEKYDQQFNKGLATTKGYVNASPIADALEAKARTLPPTSEGQGIANQLLTHASEYRGRTWTAQELNSERMFRNANAQAFYNKSDVGQMAALRANADTMVDEIVADSARDVLYDEMEKQHPGQGFRELKRKQSSVLEMQGKFKDHIRKLEAAQAKRAGAPWSEKAGISTSAHPSGAIVTPRIHVTELLRKGPLSHANKAVESAFGPTDAARMRRAVILALPVSTLVKPIPDEKAPSASTQ